VGDEGEGGGARGDLLARKGREGQYHHGREGDTLAEPHQKVAPEHAKLSDVNIELRHPEAAGGLDRESHADGGPGRDASELGNEVEGSLIAEPARGKKHADAVGCIAAR